VALYPVEQRILVQVRLGLGEHQHLDAGDDEEGAEQISQAG